VAPASSARSTVPGSALDDSISTLLCGETSSSSAMSSIPPFPGKSTSRTITSGLMCARHDDRALLGSGLADDVIPGAPSRTSRMPARTTAWSSTSKTRVSTGER
jgi:hypothetical protein